MASRQPMNITDAVPVGMGQAVFAREPTRLTTILGSCIAVTLYSPNLRLGMLSHVVLPQSNGAAGNPAKFADTAIPHMLATLQSQGAGPDELTAKIVGGACMFGNAKSMPVGQTNIQAVVRALEVAKMPIIGCDLNGVSGRRICFDLATGCITVACAGCPPRII